MGFWLLLFAGAAVGWFIGSGGGAFVGVGVGVALAMFAHLLQQRAFLFGIHNAARVGNIPRVRALLRKNPSLVNARDASGATPLHCAIVYFEAGVVEELLAHGADVNAADNNGTTPLHILAAGVPPNPPSPPQSIQLPATGLQGVHLKIAELLLAHGADVHARTAWGWTPLETAEKASTDYMVKLLRGRGANGVVVNVRL